MSSSAAEKKVKKLARLPSNTVCANCGTTKKFGFSTVCIKYYTFVCNNCKSSHQAISHRCKSLTMSSWTDEEATELQRKGNDHARRTWLKNAPPIGQGGRPKEGDPVDVFKRFVVDTYERKRYYGEDEGNIGASTGGHHSHVATAVPAPRNPAQAPARAPVVTRAPVRKAAPAPTPPPPTAPVVDLLDFSSMAVTTPQSGASNSGNSNFDAFAPVTSVTTSQRSSATKIVAPPKNEPFNSNSSRPEAMPRGSSNSFQANFDAFAPAVSVTPSTPSTDFKSATAQNTHDPFQPTIAQNISSSNTSSFSFMNNDNILATPSPAPPAPAPVPAKKKPVMNNHSISQQSSLISSMNMSAPNINMMQGNHANGIGMGWNANNNQNVFGGMGNIQSMQQQMMMQQQHMNLMNGMCINNNGMSSGMMNTNNMMMGNSNNLMMNHQQQAMMNGYNFGGMTNNTNRESKGAMNSLQMNSSSMSAWSTGLNK